LRRCSTKRSKWVCSIYLYDAETRELTLRATQGLNPESVGTVRLKLGQGLTGLALEQMQTVCENDASRNPSYKYFPGIFEERYNAFLAVPIARGVAKMGVLVLQRDSDECFNDIDITALETVASQLAHIIENAQFLLGMHEPKKETARALPQKLRVVRGKVGSEGFAYAPAEIICCNRTSTGTIRSNTFTKPWRIPPGSSKPFKSVWSTSSRTPPR